MDPGTLAVLIGFNSYSKPYIKGGSQEAPNFVNIADYGLVG